MLIPGQQRVYAGFCVGIELCNSTLPFVVRFVYERSFLLRILCQYTYKLLCINKEKKRKSIILWWERNPTPASGDGAFFTPTGIEAGTRGDSLVRKDNVFSDISISGAEEKRKVLHTQRIPTVIVLRYSIFAVSYTIDNNGLFFSHRKTPGRVTLPGAFTVFFRS